MLDNYAQESVLNGTWEGYYDHNNKVYSSKNFPITAMIEQDGKSFRGVMFDGVTEFRHDYRTIIEANEGRMSPFVENLARQTLERCPDYQIESSLPAESRVRGKILGATISFTKTYFGPYSHYGNAGYGRVLLRQINQHRVNYQGTLNPGNNVIEGEWTIRSGGFLGLFRRTVGTGKFQLVRKM
jgi:hypothetical protein